TKVVCMFQKPHGLPGTSVKTTVPVARSGDRATTEGGDCATTEVPSAVVARSPDRATATAVGGAWDSIDMTALLVRVSLCGGPPPFGLHRRRVLRLLLAPIRSRDHHEISFASALEGVVLADGLDDLRPPVQLEVNAQWGILVQVELVSGHD